MHRRVVIYTFVVGNYDTPKEPKNLPEDFSWVCIKPNSQEIKDLGINNPKMASVYYKLHPEILFPNVEWSLCLDANISITDEKFYSVISSLIDDDTVYAGIKHPQRDDIYEESWRIIRNGRDSLRNMFRVTRFLKKEGMPRHYGMDETNIILRKHSDPRIGAFDKLWWEMYCKYPKRDQMTHSYCLWKSGLESVKLLPEGENARNCPLLEYRMHGSDAHAKDKTLKGKMNDAARAFKKALFKIHLYLLGISIIGD